MKHFKYTVLCVFLLCIFQSETWKICMTEGDDDDVCDAGEVSGTKCCKEIDEFACLEGIAEGKYDVTTVRIDAAYAASKPDLGLADKLNVYGIGHKEQPEIFRVNLPGERQRLRVSYPDLGEDVDSYYQLPFTNFEATMLTDYEDPDESSSLLEKRERGVQQVFDNRSNINNYWTRMLRKETYRNNTADGSSAVLTITHVSTYDQIDQVTDRDFQKCLLETNTTCTWPYHQSLVIGTNNGSSEKNFKDLIHLKQSRKKKSTVDSIHCLHGQRFHVIHGADTLSDFSVGRFLTFEQPKSLSGTARWCVNADFFKRCLFVKHVAHYNGIIQRIDCIQKADCAKSLLDNSSDFTFMNTTDDNANLEMFANNLPTPDNVIKETGLFIRNGYPDAAREDLQFTLQCIEALKGKWFILEFIPETETISRLHGDLTPEENAGGIERAQYFMLIVVLANMVLSQ